MVMCMVETRQKKTFVKVDFNTSLYFFKNNGTEKLVSKTAHRWAALVSFTKWLSVPYMFHSGHKNLHCPTSALTEGTSLSLRPYILHLHPCRISPAPWDQVSLLVESNFTVL